LLILLIRIWFFTHLLCLFLLLFLISFWFLIIVILVFYFLILDNDCVSNRTSFFKNWLRGRWFFFNSLTKIWPFVKFYSSFLISYDFCTFRLILILMIVRRFLISWFFFINNDLLLTFFPIFAFSSSWLSLISEIIILNYLRFSIVKFIIIRIICLLRILLFLLSLHYSFLISHIFSIWKYFKFNFLCCIYITFSILVFNCCSVLFYICVELISLRSISNTFFLVFCFLWILICMMLRIRGFSLLGVYYNWLLWLRQIIF